ncbi:MAG: PH domain-containing protein [Anaerorhabdus sp.]
MQRKVYETMKDKKGVLPIVIIILRYMGTLACLGVGIFISLGNTNSMVGATMAFMCAIMICPLLDLVLEKMNLHYDTSFKALVVILSVIVDIVSSKSQYWLWINLGVSLVLIISFGFLSNIRKPDKKEKPQRIPSKRKVVEEDEDDDEEEVIAPSYHMPANHYEYEAEPKPVFKPIEVDKKQPEKSLLEKFTIFEEEEPVSKPKRIESIDTPEKCYEYMLNHGYGQGFDEKIIKENAELILAVLAPTEKILFTFMGNHQYISEFDHKGAYAYALTNRRLIFAKKGMNGQNIQAMPLSKMESVTLKKGLVDSVMTVKSNKVSISVGMDNDSCRKIAARIHRFIAEIERLRAEQMSKK